MKLLILLLLIVSCSKKDHKILFIKKNLSDVAYHKEGNQFILLVNDKKSFYIANKYLKKKKKVKIKNADNYDFEGISIIKSDINKVTIAISNEKGSVFIGDYFLNKKKINLNKFKKIKYPVYHKNKGIEGIAFQDNILYLCREKEPMEILRYDLNKDIYLSNLKISLEDEITDISSCTIHNKKLYVLSEESNKILVLKLNGSLIKVIQLKEDKQYEGITFINNKIVLVSEPNIIEFLSEEN